MTMDLTGKRAVVTGAASGIGQALAELLVQRGARVMLADLDLARVEAVAATLDGAIAVPCDVSDHASVEALAAQARFAEVEAAFAEQAPWTEESERFDVNRIVAQVLADEGPR